MKILISVEEEKKIQNILNEFIKIANKYVQVDKEQEREKFNGM